jgi:hypothetical protein
VVSHANDLTMPVYLWHMSAYLVAVALLARLGAGFVYSTDASVGWWQGRPAVIVVSAVVMGGSLRCWTGFRDWHVRLAHRCHHEWR